MVSGLHRRHVPGISADCVKAEQRSQLVSRTLMFSMLVTVLIGVGELIFWIFSRNNLFLIEGFGNLAWLVPDTIMLLAIRVGSKKADLKMNFGYRRIETLFLLFFSLAISLFVIQIIYKATTNPPEQLPAEYGLLTVLLSAAIIGILALLAQYVWDAGKKNGSRLLMLDSMILRLDIASAAILLLSGIFLVMAPTVIIIQTVLMIIVGLALLVYCVNEAVQAAKELIDASPSIQVMKFIGKIAEETPEVRYVSERRIRSYGGAIAVGLTIETDPDITVRDAHRITSILEDRIKEKVENVIDVRIRVNPSGTYEAEKTAGGDRDR